jgi:hypothetical protein
MIARALIVTLAVATAALAQSAGPSRLQFTTPERWTRSLDQETKLASLHPPGSHAVVTFSESVETKGSAENWLATVWSEMLKQMRPVGESSGGREGEFVKRASECVKSDGSKPWLCVYALVQDGRGESVIYIAANKQVFLSFLPAVTQMIRRMTVAPADAAERAPSTAAAGPPRSESIPVLAWNEPSGYYRGASKSPIEYSSNQVNAGVQIYQFRPYTGDIVAAFRRTLLRDWIAPQFAEGQLAGAPEFTPRRIPGSTLALAARFHANIAGTMNERMRMLIVAGNQAALVDASANSAYSWQRVAGPMGAMLDSIRVEQESAPPPAAVEPDPRGGGVAGLYLGFKYKYVAVYGTRQNALHYHLFSADGRVYRCYDFPPGGNDTAWKRFNFNASQREDPDNTGRYVLKGNQLLIKMGDEQFSGTIRDPNTLQIQGITYERQP